MSSASQQNLCVASPRAELPASQRTRCEIWTRVMGYLRPVNQWNPGKQAEQRERLLFVLPASIAGAGEAGLHREECVGHDRGGKMRCCNRAGEYNGYGSDGPTIFTCPKCCSCHD